MDISTILIISIIGLIITAIIPYSLAKSDYDYNIYNIENLVITFLGMAGFFVGMYISVFGEGISNTPVIIGFIIFIITTVIVFFKTLSNTNLLIALLAIIPQMFVTVIIYIITKIVLRSFLGED